MKLRGDMTVGSPTKLLIFFSIPLLVGNVFQLFYGMADTVIVGRTIGVSALAAVGSTGSLSFLVIGFVLGLTSGCSVITAQRFGAGDDAGVRRSVATSIIINAIFSLGITLISAVGTRWLLEAMQTPADIIDMAYEYIIVIFLGTTASVFYNLFSAILRSLGDSRTPLYFLILACILNIILDFVLILSFKMGVAGAGVATVIAQGLSAVLCLLYSLWRFPILRLRREDWRWDWDFAKQHMRIAMPMAFQFSITALGAMVLQWSLNSLGSGAVAAFTAASKIEQLATQALPSIGSAIATFTAQNYGAGKLDRIRQGVRQCCFLSTGAALLGGLIMVFFGKPLITFVIGSVAPEVFDMAYLYILIMAIFLIPLGLLFVYRNALQGVGSITVPMLAGVSELVARSVIALACTPFIGYLGVCLAGPGAWVSACIMLAVAYYMVIKRLS